MSTTLLAPEVKVFTPIQVAQKAKCSVCGDWIPMAYPRDDDQIICNDCLNPMICLGNLHAFGMSEEDESRLEAIIGGTEELQELEGQREEGLEDQHADEGL